MVTPHAAFLALRWAPDAALANLANLEADFDIYDKWGFRDSVNVDTGAVSDYYLSLDQGIIMAAIGNALGGRPAARRVRDEGGPERAPAAHRHGAFGAGPATAADYDPAP